MGDAGGVAVVDGALAVPGLEHGLGREPQLLARIVGERALGALLHERLEFRGDLAQPPGVEIGIVHHAARGAMAGEDGLEGLVGEIQHHGPEHLHQAPVGVGDEALVAGELHEPGGHRVVQADVEHRVHHARHREARTGAAGDEEGIRGIAQALAGEAFDARERLLDLLPHARGKAAGGEVGIAGARADDEAGRNGKPHARHLGEVGALAAEEVLAPGVALGKEVDPLFGRCGAPLAGDSGCHGEYLIGEFVQHRNQCRARLSQGC